MIRDYISVTAESSKEADIEKANVVLNKKGKQKPLDMTLYEAIDRYIESSNAILSPPTIRGYRTIQRNAFPGFLNTRLKDITNEMLRDAVNAECRRTTGGKNPKPLSSKTVINEFGLISSVLHLYAPDLDLSVKLPQKEMTQHELSTPDVIFDIVQGTNIELPVLLAMWLSFSASEILGLTKSKSISADGNYITIKEVIVRDENNNQVVKNKGKQPSRERTLEIPDYIKTLIAQVETDRLVPITGTALSKRFACLVKKSGIPYMTFHDLRHVNASIMTILHVPDKYAQERGGWKTDHVMKSRYMQTFAPERAAIDKQIDDYMSSILFSSKSDRNRAKKYNCWLTLFDYEDSVENRIKFDKFCQNHSIQL